MNDSFKLMPPGCVCTTWLEIGNHNRKLPENDCTALLIIQHMKTFGLFSLSNLRAKHV